MTTAKLFLAHELRKVAAKQDRRYDSPKSYRLKKFGPSPVAASNPVEAAELFIAHCEKSGVPVREGSRIMVCEHLWDGAKGFKIAANTNGDIRYDVRRSSEGGLFPVYSERSFS
jgi:hypothetical protein